MFDDRRGRAFPESIDELVQTLARSFSHAVDGSVGHVGHPANQAQGVRLLEDEIPITDAMDTARHARLEPARIRFGADGLSRHRGRAPRVASRRCRSSRPPKCERIEDELG